MISESRTGIVQASRRYIWMIEAPENCEVFCSEVRPIKGTVVEEVDELLGKLVKGKFDQHSR